MSIRQGYFRIGETVEVSGGFTNLAGAPMAATGAVFTILKPDDVREVYAVTPDGGGVVAVAFIANIAGTWRMRLECTGPTTAVTEGRFDVVASTVLLPPA